MRDRNSHAVRFSSMIGMCRRPALALDDGEMGNGNDLKNRGLDWNWPVSGQRNVVAGGFGGPVFLPEGPVHCWTSWNHFKPYRPRLSSQAAAMAFRWTPSTEPFE